MKKLLLDSKFYIALGIIFYSIIYGITNRYDYRIYDSGQPAWRMNKWTGKTQRYIDNEFDEQGAKKDVKDYWEDADYNF